MTIRLTRRKTMSMASVLSSRLNIYAAILEPGRRKPLCSSPFKFPIGRPKWMVLHEYLAYMQDSTQMLVCLTQFCGFPNVGIVSSETSSSTVSSWVFQPPCALQFMFRINHTFISIHSIPSFDSVALNWPISQVLRSSHIVDI